MDELLLAYLAGVMDSDGYFTIKRSTYNMRVIGESSNPNYYERCGLKQTNPVIPDLIHHYFGGYRSIEKPNCENGKQLHSIQLTNLKANTFIKAIIPYLRIKKRQAEILIELRTLIDIGKSEPTISNHLNRWGTISTFRRYKLSQSQIDKREQLIFEIKSLNDIRSYSYMPTKAVTL